MKSIIMLKYQRKYGIIFTLLFKKEGVTSYTLHFLIAFFLNKRYNFAVTSQVICKLATLFAKGR